MVVVKRSTDADENEPSLSPFAAFSSPNSEAAAFSAPLTGAANVAALAPLQPVGAPLALAPHQPVLGNMAALALFQRLERCPACRVEIAQRLRTFS